MNESTSGGTPADGAGEGFVSEWYRFEHGLRAFLEKMHDDEDHLIVELPGCGGDDDEGTAPYVQFASFGDGTMLRIELSSNVYLVPEHRIGETGLAHLELLGWLGGYGEPGSADANLFLERPLTEATEVARMVVVALRDIVGVVHPQLLAYRSWGPATEAGVEMPLCPTELLPVEAPAAVPAAPERPMMVMPKDGDQLAEAVAATLRERFDEEPTTDADGDFVLHHLGQPVWVRASKELPLVELFARVTHEVYSRRATAIEVGLVNRDHRFGKWVLREREVWQVQTINALPFAPSHLLWAIDVFFEEMSATRDDLALRTRGKVG